MRVRYLDGWQTLITRRRWRWRFGRQRNVDDNVHVGDNARTGRAFTAEQHNTREMSVRLPDAWYTVVDSGHER